MKRLVWVSLLLTMAAVMMPLMFKAGQAQPNPINTESPAVSSSPQGQVYEMKKDLETKITVLEYGELKDTTLAEYLPLVLAAEMPVSFETEALKAQTVAVRTYIMYCDAHRKSAHPDASVCSDSKCCLAFRDETQLRAAWGADYENNMASIKSAVAATDGQVLEYEGQPILAAFHSSSAGKTESGSELWGSVPYLTSVSSPETADDVPNYVTTVEVTSDNFKETIAAKYPELKLEGEASAWVADAQCDDSGRVRSISICGQSISGSDMRTLFALRSTAFELKYNDGVFVFTVTGYGHGLGMSQYGANVMAKKGFTYTEILNHYYEGANLT